jgi:hypothetical protein
MEEPKVAKSNTAKAEPNRAKLLREISDPRLRKSRTDNVDPMRHTPNTENEDPQREKLLRDSEDPNFRKSRTDMVDPSRAKLRNDTVAPK